MNFINALTKFVSQFTNPTKKEVSKMKKLMIISAVVLLAIGLNVLPAMAYTTIGGTAVSISASGTLSGSTITFSAAAVDQNTGLNSGGTISFPAPSSTDLTNSLRALKVTGGTNEVNARIIIYTDNANNTGSDVVPTIDPNTGVDGAGLVGRSNPGYAVPLVWARRARLMETQIPT